MRWLKQEGDSFIIQMILNGTLTLKHKKESQRNKELNGWCKRLHEHLG